MAFFVPAGFPVVAEIAANPVAPVTIAWFAGGASDSWCTGFAKERGASREREWLAYLAMNASATKSSIAHVHIPCPRVGLWGELAVPHEPRAMVILVHDSKDGWTDCRNWPIAWKLYRSGFATLLVNLLDPEEQALQYAKGFPHFEMPLLVERLAAIVRWARARDDAAPMKTGVLASKMAAAASIEAAVNGIAIDALACKAARTDLVQDIAPRLAVPILLVADEGDHRSRKRHWEFSRALGCDKKLVTLKGCRHRSNDEMSTLQTAQLAVDWFSLHLEARQERPEYLVAS